MKQFFFKETILNKEDACFYYATAWNRLDPEVLIQVLDDDVTYSSQSVLASMRGKEEVADYLRGKMATIRADPAFKVFAQLAETQVYPMYTLPPESCVVLSQGEIDNLVATVLFEVSETGIRAIHMCIIPPPHTTKLSGEFPD